MRYGLYEPCGLRTGVDGEIQRCVDGRLRWIRMRQDKPRHSPGERRLADAFRCRDEPGMGEPPAAIGAKELRLRCRMADETARVTGVGGARKSVAFGDILDAGRLHD